MKISLDMLDHDKGEEITVVKWERLQRFLNLPKNQTTHRSQIDLPQTPGYILSPKICGKSGFRVRISLTNNNFRFGPRFPATNAVYSKDLQEIFRKAANERGTW